MKKIVIMGANAARQKTVVFENFRYGEVNRASSVTETASGKGINFCRAAGSWGRVSGVVVQFCGGGNGDFVCDALDRENLSHRTIRCAAPLRCCTTVIDAASSTMTELIEPSFAATAAECDDFVRVFNAETADAAGIAICGSLPDGTDPSLYSRCAAAAAGAGLPVLIDVFKNAGSLFELPGTILKINREELAVLTGISGIKAGIKALFNRFPFRAVAITDGPAAAYASNGRRIADYFIPKLEKVGNPIGCGDTCGAVMLSELLCGTDIFTAFKLSLGAASANAETMLPAKFDPKRGLELAGRIIFTIQDL